MDIRSLRENFHRDYRETGLTDVCDCRKYRGMSEKHLDPAKTIIAKAGGVDAVASITGKHVSRIYRWMHPREKGGTGGVVPHADATKLLRHAQETGIEITAADFFAPADEAAA